MFNTYALKIYRQAPEQGKAPVSGTNSHQDIEVQLQQLWPEDKLHILWSTDGPQWFAHEQFSFSGDNRKLILRTKWGDTHLIDLLDGRID